MDASRKLKVIKKSAFERLILMKWSNNRAGLGIDENDRSSRKK